MEHELEKLGLDETESRVYLALLELGPSTVTEVTKKARVTRTLGYHVLEKLGWYGLVNTVSSHGEKRRYAAEHPRALMQHVRNKRQGWVRKEQQAERLLPDLVSLYKIAEKPTVKYHRDIKGIISLFEESLEAETEILSVLDVESWHVPEFWDWAQSYNRERNKRKIREKILILDTPAGRDWVASYKGSRTYTQYRWVHPEDVKHLLDDFGGEVNVYDNKVVMALLRKPNRMCVSIDSSVFANIIRALFEIVWKQAPPVFDK